MSKKKSARARKESAAKQAAAQQKAPPATAEVSAPEITGDKPISAEAPSLQKVAPAKRAVSLRERMADPNLAAALFAFLMFAAMTVQTAKMSVILPLLALVLSIGRGPLRRMQERFCIPVLGLLLYVLIAGLGTAVYTRFRDTSLAEYNKLIAAFALAVILLVRFDKRHIRGLLWGYTIVSAIISLLCIDGANGGLFFHAFKVVAEALGGDYTSISLLGGRVNGIYNDANVTASLAALGCFVPMYLGMDGKRRWERPLAFFLLGLNAQGFFLALSRGGILCFGLSLLVWLVAAGKGKRLRLFALMFVSAAVTMAFSIPIMLVIGTNSPIVGGLTLLTGVVIYLLDWAVGERFARLLEGRGKVIAMAAAVLAVLCVVFVVAALNMTKAHTFQGEESLIRAVRVEQGEYTLSCAGDGLENVAVTIYSRTREQALMNDAFDLLYEGPVSGAAFTSPGTDANIFFDFSSSAPAELRQAVLSNGVEITMDYRLLPSFLVDRFQGGLFWHSSYLLRAQFMKDAFRIFWMSPLIGSGLGSTENLYTAIQPFYYQTHYVHNHILQYLCDTGLVGLAGMLGLLGGSLWLILRRLRQERHDPLAVLLLVCWVMMNSHGFMDFNFSLRMYLCTALFFHLLPVLLYARPLTAAAAKVGGWAMCLFTWVYLAVFGGLLESRQMVQREASQFSTTDVVVFMDTLESFVSRNVFDPIDFQLEFLVNAVALDSDRYNPKMLEYVEQLRSYGTYYACSGLTQYYYLPGGDFGELFVCSREGTAQRAADPAAWDIQVDFYRNSVLPAAQERGAMDRFIDGVVDYQTYLNEFNQGRMEEVVLREDNQAFLDAAAHVREAGMSGEEAYAYMSGF